jgi:hypothetical protein
MKPIALTELRRAGQRAECRSRNLVIGSDLSLAFWGLKVVPSNSKVGCPRRIHPAIPGGDKYSSADDPLNAAVRAMILSHLAWTI